MRESNPELHRQRVSDSLRGKFGEQSRRWKGEEAGYVAIHLWLSKHYPKGDHCEHCNNTNPSRLEWSNLSGTYSRDREDWQVLCPSCHRKFDASNICKHGHLKILENLYSNPKGHRECRVCRGEAQRRFHAKTN